jgi:regulator of sirC expression with transglutaminase-like and TPR domain
VSIRSRLAAPGGLQYVEGSRSRASRPSSAEVASQSDLEDRRVRPGPFADSPEFRRLAAGEAPVDLARIALEIAADAYPGLEIGAYLARIRELAERVRPRCPRTASVRDILGQINWVLFVEEELRGNHEEYYDPRNSYLNEVLDRRLGIPISLSILYWAVAEPLGLSVAGANLPAHFMLRVDDGDRTWFVDPFHSGAVMSREMCRRRLSEILRQPVDLDDAMAAPCSVATVVTRMLRNLKAIYLREEDLPSVLPVLRRLAALNPLDPDEVRDLGVVCLKADRPGEAVDPLQAFLAAAPSDARAPEIAALLDTARRRLAEWN